MVRRVGVRLNLGFVRQICCESAQHKETWASIRIFCLFVFASVRALSWTVAVWTWLPPKMKNQANVWVLKPSQCPQDLKLKWPDVQEQHKKHFLVSIATFPVHAKMYREYIFTYLSCLSLLPEVLHNIKFFPEQPTRLEAHNLTSHNANMTVASLVTS